MSERALVNDEGWVRGPNDEGWVSEGDLASDLSALCSVANADYECEHGRLAGDTCPSPVVKFLDGTTVQSWPHDHPCGCFASEQITVERIVVRETAPNLMSTFKRAKEAAVETNTEAPFGYKADGTPRKRRAATPEVQAKMAAARKAKAAAQLAAPPATAVAPEPEPDPPAARSTPEPDPIEALADQLAEQLDQAEVTRDQLDERLTELQEQIEEVAKQHTAADAKVERLGRAKLAVDELLAHDDTLALAA